MIEILFTTKSPLCQIDKTEDASSAKNPIIKVKKQKVFVEDFEGGKKPLSVPIYTGNGFRGMLRRETLAVMFDAMVANAEEGELIIPTPEDFHLMNSGGGSLFQEQPFEIEDKIRELNPQLSLFGTSLAVKGKLRVSNLVPLEIGENGEFFYHFFKSKKGDLYSSILADTTVISRDGILDNDKNSQFLTREQIEEWLEKADENNRKRAASRDEEKKDKKVKKLTIRGAIDREYVAVGVDFFGGISEKEKLTSVEKGLLIKGLERAVLNNLGATSSNDFGKVEYQIRIDETSFLETSVNQYGKCEIIKRSYSEELLNDIQEVEDFLANITKESFEITKLMTKK